MSLRDRAVWHGVDETAGFEWTWIELLGALRALGDFIESRLAGMSDRRSREAVRAWRARADHGRLKVIEAATGYPRELVAEVESVFYSENERDWAEPRSDEIPNWGSSLPVLT